MLSTPSSFSSLIVSKAFLFIGKGLLNLLITFFLLFPGIEISFGGWLFLEFLELLVLLDLLDVDYIFITCSSVELTGYFIYSIEMKEDI